MNVAVDPHIQVDVNQGCTVRVLLACDVMFRRHAIFALPTVVAFYALASFAHCYYLRLLPGGTLISQSLHVRPANFVEVGCAALRPMLILVDQISSPPVDTILTGFALAHHSKFGLHVLYLGFCCDSPLRN
jgi:hypothetical protein